MMRNRFARRLIFAVGFVALFDQFVPPLLRRVEAFRYESGPVFRFENSDLFALGPTVSYLREHPRGTRPRMVFFGNSIIWGYLLDASSALPARYQQLHAEAKVFNMAVNGFQTGSSYLISKAIIDSVDSLFVLTAGDSANPQLPRLIPVDAADLDAFGLRAFDPVERWLEARLGVWRLYASSYRLQAALFGTSTRQYIYLHKGELARRLIAPPSASRLAPGARPSDPDRVVLRAPHAPEAPATEHWRQVERDNRLLWEFAELAVAHRKRVVFLQIDAARTSLEEPDVAAFNAAFAPFAEIVTITVPASLKFDGMHLTSQGASAVAEALALHEAARDQRR